MSESVIQKPDFIDRVLIAGLGALGYDTDAPEAAIAFIKDRIRGWPVAEEPEWQYSYVERIGRHGDVHERVTFGSLGSAQQYLRANADSIIGWNREVKKRDHKTAGVEKRRMNIGDWVPVEHTKDES